MEGGECNSVTAMPLEMGAVFRATKDGNNGSLGGTQAIARIAYLRRTLQKHEMAQKGPGLPFCTDWQPKKKH